jgi:hypothetical protein
MRWWAIVGLNLLGEKASSVKASVEKALEDKEHEISMMAAWTLIKMGDKEKGLSFISTLLNGKCNNIPMLHCMIDWMGEPGLALAKKYIENGGKARGKYGDSILGHVVKRSQHRNESSK